MSRIENKKRLKIQIFNEVTPRNWANSTQHSEEAQCLRLHSDTDQKERAV